MAVFKKVLVFAVLALSVMLAGFASDAQAGPVKVAVFGDNSTDDFINSQFGAGSAILVSDAQLATPGFLVSNGFNAVYVTRNGASFGSGLSAGAAANVKAFVGADGNVVLFPGDWADMLGGVGDPVDANVQALTKNAVDFAAASGHGYIGEFNGASMGVAGNANGFNPLDFFAGAGAAGGLGFFSDGVDIVSLTPFGVGHPVTLGVTFPFAPAEASTFRTSITGLPPQFILANWQDNVPAIIVRGVIPEPTSLAVFGLVGLVSAGAVALRKRIRAKA